MWRFISKWFRRLRRFSDSERLEQWLGLLLAVVCLAAVVLIFVIRAARNARP